MILAELDHPGGESADQRRAHRDRGRQHRRIEEGIDRKVGELFHTFIVNELRARFDEVRGCVDGGVVPTLPKRRRSIMGSAAGPAPESKRGVTPPALTRNVLLGIRRASASGRGVRRHRPSR
jgi:hypothetical protein